MVILRLKNINFSAIKFQFFLEDLDIDNVLVSNKISSGEKNQKYFIGYSYNYKIKQLHIILPKTSTYVKSSN